MLQAFSLQWRCYYEKIFNFVALCLIHNNLPGNVVWIYKWIWTSWYRHGCSNCRGGCKIHKQDGRHSFCSLNHTGWNSRELIQPEGWRQQPVYFFDIHYTSTMWNFLIFLSFCGNEHTTKNFPFSFWTWILSLRIQLEENSSKFDKLSKNV